MGAHSTIQIPLDVARRVYKQVSHPNAPQLSLEELERFYDRALDEQLYNVMFGPWLVGLTYSPIDENDVLRWVTEYLEANPARRPGSAEEEIAYLRTTLANASQSLPALQGINWERDTVGDIKRKLGQTSEPANRTYVAHYGTYSRGFGDAPGFRRTFEAPSLEDAQEMANDYLHETCGPDAYLEKVVLKVEV